MLKLVARAMHPPDDLVIEFDYCDSKGAVTHRVVSPIRFLGSHRFLALCLSSDVSHPIHLLTLHAMGVHIFDNCDLEELSETATRLKRWEFLVTAAPIAVEGGTGSPLNPIVMY